MDRADANAAIDKTRFGAIVGPTLGGVLLARELPPQRNVLIVAIPALVATIAALAYALSLQGAAGPQTVAMAVAKP